MGFLDFLFPKRCLGCGSVGKYLCRDCVIASSFARQVCVECGRASIDGLTHAGCKKPLSLDGVVSVWVYEKVIRKAIISLKYKFASEVAKDLAINISKFLRENIHALPKGAVLIPVPLHRVRKNWRGFNQSAEIAKLISLYMGWNYVESVVLRKKLTQTQIELKKKERKKNIFGAFSYNPFYRSLITNKKNFIIFDDVITTGATIKEVGKVLKRNGAKIVWGLTIAR